MHLHQCGHGSGRAEPVATQTSFIVEKKVRPIRTGASPFTHGDVPPLNAFSLFVCLFFFLQVQAEEPPRD